MSSSLCVSIIIICPSLCPYSWYHSTLQVLERLPLHQDSSRRPRFCKVCQNEHLLFFMRTCICVCMSLYTRLSRVWKMNKCPIEWKMNIQTTRM
jgi:hypothetical protein